MNSATPQRRHWLILCFLRGMLALLPAAVTVLIIAKVVDVVNDSLATPINRGLGRLVYSWRGLDPAAAVPLPWIVGFSLALGIFFVAGLIFHGLIGRRLFELLESWINRLPVFGSIYPYAREIVDFFSGTKRPQTQGTVFVEYPRKGLYSVGFITNDKLKTPGGDNMVSIFILSSPTPITGYTILVPPSRVYPLHMAVDEALRYSMSAGVLIPEHQKLNDTGVKRS